MAADEPRAGADAPFGTTAMLRRMAGTVDQRQAQPGAPPRTQRVQPVTTRGPDAALEQDQDISGGYDEVLFAPSDRPDEPITHGAAFGPGSNFVQLPYEDEYAFRRRVADDLEAGGTASLAPYVAKLRAGG